jgi:hypothetical protein
LYIYAPMEASSNYEIKIRLNGKQKEIFDVLRKKWIQLKPEEEVRQKCVHFLIHQRGFPAGRLAVEYGLKVNRMFRRADVVAFDNFGHPLLLVECKAPKIKITQKVFDQIARYNLALRVDYLMVTNGNEQYCCSLDFNNKEYKFLKDIPYYDSIL